MKTIVHFSTSMGEFAVPVEYACEVCPAKLIALPDPADGVGGLMDWGGSVITVISNLGGGSRHVLVLDVGKGPFGLLVDEVREVVPVPEGKFLPAPHGQHQEAVQSIVHLNGSLVMVIDVELLWTKILDAPSHESNE
jgi:chemotaxis signal transduction protein